MSKVSTYLQGHLLGEVATRLDVRDQFSRDSSVLSRAPEMVIYPRTTNDIRKLARFAWQLAEKGHILEITPRGGGTDTTGAATGKGAILVLPVHMSQVFEYEPRQRLVRAQAGATIGSLQNTLRMHGAALRGLPRQQMLATVGGAVAANASGEFAGKEYSILKSIRQIEVVLDNGDVLQTGPISKRSYSQLCGSAGRIGDLYRGIDTVLEEHAELISQMNNDGPQDKSGYPGIAQVRLKGGGIDLTPLFVGSQGTLGVITELILQADHVAGEPTYIVATYTSQEHARDGLSELRKLAPPLLEYFDGALLQDALKQGANYQWCENSGKIAAFVVLGFDSASERTIAKQVKRANKALSKQSCDIYTSGEHGAETLAAIRDVARYTKMPMDTTTIIAPTVVDGLYVPHEHFESFLDDYRVLCDALNVDAPLYGDALTGHYTVQPQISLRKATDKKKLLKLMDQLATLSLKHGGALVGSGSEGRLLSRFVRATWNDEYELLMDKVKKVFDPHCILNPGVKSNVELRSVATELRSDNAIYHPLQP